MIYNRNHRGTAGGSSGGNRNGMDQLSRFLLFVALGFSVVGGICRIWVFLVLALGFIIFAYYRAFSRNVSKRYAENQSYLQFVTNLKGSFNRFKLRREDKKTHKIFKCPNCSQKIRVPKGKGSVRIKCPNCRIEFIKNTGKQP